jgi:uncharacterized protein
MIPMHRDVAAIEVSNSVIAEMHELAPSLVFATVITGDGFEIGRSVRDRDGADRLAGMSSSLQALSDAVARELAIGTAKYVVIEAENARLLQLRVPGQPSILVALFDHHELLGKALAISRQGVDRLASLLSERQKTIQ